MLNERNTLLEDDGIEEEILVEEECSVAQAVWGDIQGNIENQTDLQNALDAKQDSLTEAQLNAVNSGITSEKVTTYDGYADQIASKANQSALNAESIARGEADTALGRRIDNEALARQQADNGLQSQIDAITSKSDVVDVVANYAALQAYDTSTLGNNDVVKVLDDETHEDALTYYRWSTTTQTWSYIGQEAPYYSKGQMDVMLQGKQDKLTAGANIQIQNGTISATDTTYTAGNGLNLEGTEFSADTDILATKEDLEGYYTKTETDIKLAPKLEAEVVAELPATGEEGKLYLTPKAHTTQTATGNPITATVAEEAGAIESFQLDGDTFQQSYTGKNLSPNAGAYNYRVNQSATISSKTESSITFTSSGNSNSGVLMYKNTQSEVCPEMFEEGYVFSCTAVADKTITLRFGTSGHFTEAVIGTTPTRISAPLYGADWICYNAATNVATITISDFQVESGSMASDYEPYVGGVPSPNPDYPQPIQTVTGTQTISINGTDYPLNLGSIELCKLGTYQDYIWKDGEDWKVHKNCKTITLNGSEDWQYSSTYDFFYAGAISGMEIPVNAGVACYCRTHNGLTSSNSGPDFATEASNYTYAADVHTTQALVRIKDTRFSSTQALATWLEQNNTTIYYVVKTATDTTITDTTLIAQLEAIRTASLQNGTNTITNTATGTNLAGDMEIGYFGFNPTNRYDKFIWLNLNNNYEQIGGE